MKKALSTRYGILLSIITFIWWNPVRVYSQVCTPTVTVIAGVGISNVRLNTLNNNSTVPGGYQDFTGISAPNLIQGQTYKMHLSVGSSIPGLPFDYKVWIDWDQSGDFSGPLEQAATGTMPSGLYNTYFNVIVPGGATLGNTLMRVSLIPTALGLPDTCNQNGGEIEDYLINVTAPSAMTYNGSNSATFSDDCVPQGAVDQAVISIVVNTNGNLAPLSVTSFSLSTNGCTNAAGDVLNARIWYTGRDPKFYTPLNSFGTTLAPNGNFTINGNQDLVQGNNYFWLTYDIAPGATVGNNLDAECLSITVGGGPQVPTITAPAGNSSIGTGLFSYVTKEANIWHMGNAQGIDFNCVAPVSINGGQTTSSPGAGLEGVSSIADINGNLLFYTNGVHVWNSIHEHMPNGTGLTSNVSSTQGALIVPQPGNDSIYYLFTASSVGLGTMDYSIINTHLDNGKGDVIPASKNTNLHILSSEHATAVHHCNGTDVWIILVDYTSRDFYSYLLTNAGLQAPVISSGLIPGGTGVGQMMASPTGKHLGLVNGNFGTMLYDFDAFSGKVCNPRNLISGNGTGNYGLSFSPDGSKLYTTRNGFPLVDVIRFDLNAGNTAAIIASNTFVASPQYSAGQMQMGPDGKIYITKLTNSHFSSISNPNGAFVFTDDAIDMAPNVCGFGIPNFVQSWFLDTSYVEPLIAAKFGANNACIGDTIFFTDSSTFYSDCPNFAWNFDDPSSGTQNTSSLSDPWHIYNNPGVYSVTLTLQEGCQEEMFVKQINIGPDTIDISASGPLSFCSGDSVILTSSSNYGHVWSTGHTSQSIRVDTSGIFHVTVTDSMGCIITDSVMVTVTTSTSATITDPGPFCETAPATQLQSAQAGGTWTGSGTGAGGLFTPSTAGVGVHQIKYEIVGACPSADSIDITVLPVPVPDAGLGTTISLGNTANLNVTGGGVGFTYMWEPSEGLSCTNCQSPVASPTITTTFCARVISPEGCSDTSCVTITVNDDCPAVFLPNVFSPNGDSQNDELCIMGNSCLKFSQLTIYNRWGEIVFSSSDPTACWDGSYKGKILNTQVFSYVFDSTTIVDEVINKRGSITLIR